MIKKFEKTINNLSGYDYDKYLLPYRDGKNALKDLGVDVDNDVLYIQYNYEDKSGASQGIPFNVEGSYTDQRDQILNHQINGYGVYMRRHPRWVRIDIDDKDYVYSDEHYPLQPHTVVKSKNGAHIYYLCDEEISDIDAAAVEGAAALRFGADPSISRIGSLLRIPGSIHQKAGYYKTEILHSNKIPAYTFEQLRNQIGYVTPDLVALYVSCLRAGFSGDLSWWGGSRLEHLRAYLNFALNIATFDTQGLLGYLLDFNDSAETLRHNNLNFSTLFDATKICMYFEDKVCERALRHTQATIRLACTETNWGKLAYYVNKNSELMEDLKKAQADLANNLSTQAKIKEDLESGQFKGIPGKNEAEKLRLGRLVDTQEKIEAEIKDLQDLYRSYGSITADQSRQGRTILKSVRTTETYSGGKNALAPNTIITTCKYGDMSAADLHAYMRDNGLQSLNVYAMCHENTKTGANNAVVYYHDDRINHWCGVCNKSHIMMDPTNPVVHQRRARKIKNYLQFKPEDKYLVPIRREDITHLLNPDKPLVLHTTAPLGCGKSNLMAILSADFLASISVSPTAALAGKLAHDTNAVCYKDCSPVIEDARVAITLDSIMRIPTQPELGRNAIFVIDEYTQIAARAVNDPNLKLKALAALNHLRNLIRVRAEVVCFADALGSEAELMDLLDILGLTDCDRMELKPPTQVPAHHGLTIYNYADKGHIIADLLQHVQAKGKAGVAVSSRSAAQALAATIIMADPTLSVMVVSGAPNDTETGEPGSDDGYASICPMMDIKTFCSDINKYASLYDVIIYTTTMASGVSCDLPGYSIYMILDHVPGMPYQSYMQMSLRFRKPAENKIKIWMSDDPEKSNRYFKTFQDYADEFIGKVEHTLKNQHYAAGIAASDDDQLIPQRAWNHFYLRTACRNYNDSVAPKTMFLEELFASTGGNIIDLDSTDAAEDRGIEVDEAEFEIKQAEADLKDVRAALREEDLKALAKAPLLSRREREQLVAKSKKGALTYEEMKRLDKTHIVNKLGGEALAENGDLTDDALKAAKNADGDGLSEADRAGHVILGMLGGVQDFRFFHAENQQTMRIAGHSYAIDKSLRIKQLCVGFAAALGYKPTSNNYVECCAYLDALGAAACAEEGEVVEVGPAPVLDLTTDSGTPLTLEEIGKRIGPSINKLFSARKNGKLVIIKDPAYDKKVRELLKNPAPKKWATILRMFFDNQGFKLERKTWREEGELKNGYTLACKVPDNFLKNILNRLMKLSYTNIDALIPELTPEQIAELGFAVNGVSTPLDPSAAGNEIYRDLGMRGETNFEPVKPTPDGIEVFHLEPFLNYSGEAQNQPLSASEISTLMLSLFTSDGPSDPQEDPQES